jgi:hypothetical protein
MSDGIEPGQEEVWRRFAAEIGARYLPGDFWTREQIVATVPPWSIKIEVDKDTAIWANVACTRLTARYVTLDSFSFTIFRLNASRDTDPLAESPEIVVGDPDFDAAFRVGGSDRQRTLQLLSNDALRAYLMAAPHVRLESSRIQGTEPLSELVCMVPEVLETRKRLLGLFELMAETLQHLRAIESAADKSPVNVV